MAVEANAAGQPSRRTKDKISEVRAALGRLARDHRGHDIRAMMTWRQP